MERVEIWKPISGYEGLYEVSNLGRVKSLERDVVKGKGGVHHLPERILRPATNTYGYLIVRLCKNGKAKNYTVHRLVAEAFIPNPEGLPEVNHIDEDKTNNCVSNLEWCDRKYNMNYGTRTAKVSKPVQQLTLNGKLVAEYPSISEAARSNGCAGINIARCCKGGYAHSKRGKWVNIQECGGFKWQYKNG